MWSGVLNGQSAVRLVSRFDPAQFRVTAFATGINYVLGMDRLPDGSILAAITDGPNYFGSNGRLVRFPERIDARRAARLADALDGDER